MSFRPKSFSIRFSFPQRLSAPSNLMYVVNTMWAGRDLLEIIDRTIKESKRATEVRKDCTVAVFYEPQFNYSFRPCDFDWHS